MGQWLEPKDFKCQSQAPDSLKPGSQLFTTPGLQGAWAEGGGAGGVATRNRLPSPESELPVPRASSFTAVSLFSGADAPHLCAPTVSSQARKIPGPWTLGHRGDLGAQHGPDQGK